MEILDFQRPNYTEEEYFDLLETSEEKLEYTKGKITRVDVYNRQGDGQWLMRSYIRLDQLVKIKTLGLEVPMTEIYKRAEF